MGVCRLSAKNGGNMPEFAEKWRHSVHEIARPFVGMSTMP